MLTDAGLRALIRTAPLGSEKAVGGDAYGLTIKNGLRVQSFYYVYRRPADGKPARMRLGEYPVLSLAEARDRARALRVQVRSGIDPMHSPHSQSAAEAIVEYLEKRVRPNCRAVSATETARYLRLASDTLPPALSECTKADIAAICDGYMARGHGYAANRAFSALHSFFEWCVARDMVPSNPMQGMRKPFAGEKPRETFLTIEEARNRLAEADPVARLCLLTGCRVGEAIGMRPGEIVDSEQGPLWIKPGSRTKSGRVHCVPLAPLALEAAQAVLAAPDRRRRRAAGYHVLRHTVRTHLDRLGIPSGISDRLLGHASGGSVGDRVYSHWSYLPEMRAAMCRWEAELN